MSVRRLAPKEVQPASFAFTDENLAFAKQQIATGRCELRWAGMTSFWGYLAGTIAVAIVCEDHGVPTLAGA